MIVDRTFEFIGSANKILGQYPRLAFAWFVIVMIFVIGLVTLIFARLSPELNALLFGIVIASMLLLYALAMRRETSCAETDSLGIPGKLPTHTVLTSIPSIPSREELFIIQAKLANAIDVTADLPEPAVKTIAVVNEALRDLSQAGVIVTAFQVQLRKGWARHHVVAHALLELVDQMLAEEARDGIDKDPAATNRLTDASRDGTQTG